MTPRENCNISGYKDPNELYPYLPDREQNLISMVKVLDLEGETVTRGSLYKFSMLSSPERSHLGKNIISPNW